MGDGKPRRLVTWAAFLFLIFLLSACNGGFGVETPAPGGAAQAYAVDITFKEFYQALGGQQILGPVISATEIRRNLQCQFTERALMCYNPSVVGTGRFSLYPLGRELGIQEDSVVSSVSSSSDARVVDGFTIYEKFLPSYDRLFGANYVGRPLTALRINQDLKRVEQFFENVGFYQDLSDPNGPVFLIPYGAYLCGANCSYRLHEYWSIIQSSLVEQVFGPSVIRLGGPAVFGSLLLKPQLAADGSMEQAYTNAVFYASPDDLTQVRLRPLPKILGYEFQPLTSKIDHDQLVFYEIENGLGHNVPKQFDSFITMHGGRDLSGNPISEVILIKNQNLFEQCFETYCLIFDPAASGALKVRMAPLGKEYIEKFPPPEKSKIQNLFSPDRISLVVSADKPNLNDNEEQYIRMLVQEKDNGQPIERVEATIVLKFQDGRSVRYFFPPSDDSGMSLVVVPPQPGVTNGSRLAYQVCLNLPSEKPICAQDSYMIWNVIQP